MSDLTPPVPDEPTRFTAEAYFALAREGVLSARDRVELLEGVIVEMSPMDPLHAEVVTRLAELLVPLVAGRARVRIQSPLVLGPRSVPEPDVAVVPGRPGSFAARHPDTALLVLEVARSSVARDRLSKTRIYARAGIPEYWIVNLRDAVLERLRDPDVGLAAYRDAQALGPGDRVELRSLPGVALDVADVLPPRADPSDA